MDIQIGNLYRNPTYGTYALVANIEDDMVEYYLYNIEYDKSKDGDLFAVHLYRFIREFVPIT